MVCPFECRSGDQHYGHRLHLKKVPLGGQIFWDTVSERVVIIGQTPTRWWKTHSTAVTLGRFPFQLLLAPKESERVR